MNINYNGVRTRELASKWDIELQAKEPYRSARRVEREHIETERDGRVTESMLDKEACILSTSSSPVHPHSKCTDALYQLLRVSR